MRDYTGLRHERLVAVRFDKLFNKRRYWIFKCDCGKEKSIRVNNVISKKPSTRSCGCAAKPLYINNLNRVIRGYKTAALKKGLSYNISDEYFEQLIYSNCHYCNTPPSKKIMNIELLRNGIDRIDNKIGYEYNNVCPCCEMCNRAKRGMPVDDFKDWIKRIINNRKQPLSF